MSEIPPENPERGSFEHEPLISPEFNDELLISERNVLHDVLSQKIESLRPFIDKKGVAYFQLEGEVRHSVLLVSRYMEEKFTHVLIHNAERFAKPGEPYFPNGDTLEMRDLAMTDLPAHYLGNSETLYREPVTAWDLPRSSVLMDYDRQSHVWLVGHPGSSAGSSPLRTLENTDIEPIKSQIESLEYFYNVIDICGPETHQPDIRVGNG